MLIYSLKNYKIFYQKIFKHEKVDDSLSKSSQQRQNIIVKRKIVKFCQNDCNDECFRNFCGKYCSQKSFKGYFCFLKNYPDPEIDLFEMVTCTRYKSSYNDIIISVYRKL